MRAIVTALADALVAAGLPPKGDPNPWYNPSLGEYASLLERAGFDVAEASHFDRMTPLDGGEAGLRNWLEMWATDFLAHVPASAQPRVIVDVETRLRPLLYRDGVWTADYRRLRVVAASH